MTVLYLSDDQIDTIFNINNFQIKLFDIDNFADTLTNAYLSTFELSPTTATEG